MIVRQVRVPCRSSARRRRNRRGSDRAMHAAGDGVVGGDVERRRAGRGEQAAVIFGRGQQEARDPPGERRLAHAARPGDQPAVVQPALPVSCRGTRPRPRACPNRRGVSRGWGAPSTRSGSGKLSSLSDGRAGHQRRRRRWRTAWATASAATARARCAPSITTEPRGNCAASARNAVAHPASAWRGPYPRTAVRCPVRGRRRGTGRAPGSMSISSVRSGSTPIIRSCRRSTVARRSPARDALIDAGANPRNGR